jgi:hypothetical protein
MPRLTLPRHDFGMRIEHINDFSEESGMCTVEEWIYDEECPCEYQWKNDQSKRMAVTLKSIWTIDYYPYNRNTCYKLASYSLPALLSFAQIGSEY